MNASSQERLMAPRKRSPKVTITAENSVSEDDANGTTMDDPRGSQGADDQIVKNMAKALKESVSSLPGVTRRFFSPDFSLD